MDAIFINTAGFFFTLCSAVLIQFDLSRVKKEEITLDVIYT